MFSANDWLAKATSLGRKWTRVSSGCQLGVSDGSAPLSRLPSPAYNTEVPLPQFRELCAMRHLLGFSIAALCLAGAGGPAGAGRQRGAGRFGQGHPVEDDRHHADRSERSRPVGRECDGQRARQGQSSLRPQPAGFRAHSARHGHGGGDLQRQGCGSQFGAVPHAGAGRFGERGRLGSQRAAGPAVDRQAQLAAAGRRQAGRLGPGRGRQGQCRRAAGAGRGAGAAGRHPHRRQGQAGRPRRGGARGADADGRAAPAAHCAATKASSKPPWKTSTASSSWTPKARPAISARPRCWRN